jgi:cytochrome b involved in lipid metabolism
MNQNKSLPVTIGVIVIIIAILVVASGRSSKTVVPAPDKEVSTETSNPNGTTVPPKTTDSYTMATVASHKSPSDCWTTINGSVYNVTSWIKQHPGGAQAIISLCGIDGSVAFNGQHGGQARPASELASFKIGTLAK